MQRSTHNQPGFPSRREGWHFMVCVDRSYVTTTKKENYSKTPFIWKTAPPAARAPLLSWLPKQNRLITNAEFLDQEGTFAVCGLR